jgi:hypothetical protein
MDRAFNVQELIRAVSSVMAQVTVTHYDVLPGYV